jgi:hypothetical protein
MEMKTRRFHQHGKRRIKLPIKAKPVEFILDGFMKSIGWVTATGIIPSGGTPCHFIFKQRHDGGIVRKETLKGELVTGVDIVVSAHGRITDFGRLARCILNLE